MSLRRDFIKIPLAGVLAGAMALPAMPAFAQQVALQSVTFKQSHGGSGKQARSVLPCKQHVFTSASVSPASARVALSIEVSSRDRPSALSSTD